jgi:hypothetical protein
MRAAVVCAAVTVGLFLLTLVMVGKPVLDDVREATPPTPSTLVVELVSTTVKPPAAVARTAPIPVMVREAFARFGPVVAGQAVRVADCETGGTFNPRARSGSHYGLFQISRRWHDARVRRLGFTWTQMTQVGPNVAVAIDIYRESGWVPWTCRRVL